MSRDDSDIESSNPSKNFKIGDFDRLSGFFTPVWESKRRIRSESPIPASSPGSTPRSAKAGDAPRSSKASEPGAKVTLSAKAAAAKAIAAKAAAANAAAAKAAAAREAAIKAAAARAAVGRSGLTRTSDVKAAVAAPAAAAGVAPAGVVPASPPPVAAAPQATPAVEPQPSAPAATRASGGKASDLERAGSKATAHAPAAANRAVGNKASVVAPEAIIETPRQSPLGATLAAPVANAKPKVAAAQKTEAPRPSDEAAATRGSTPPRAVAGKNSRVKGSPAPAPAKSNPAAAAPPGAVAERVAAAPPVMDPYRTTPPPVAVGARPVVAVIPMPPPTPRLSGRARAPSVSPSAAVAALKQAGPNLPPEAFLDAEPDFRAPAVAAPGAPRVEKPALHYRSLRASVAATAVHEQLRAKLQTPPLSFPESQGVMETYSEAMPVTAAPARSDAPPNEYLSQQLLRRLRRTIRLSAALPESVRALIARHDRH